MIVTFLKDHYSEETAYMIEDYPIGFTARGQKKIWIETKKAEQRVVYRTTDKNGRWCKPKASTYEMMKLLYLDEQGHVQSTSITIYTNPMGVKAFVDRIGELDETAQQRLTAIAGASRKVESDKWVALDLYMAALNSGDTADDDFVLVVLNNVAVAFHKGEEVRTEDMRYAKRIDPSATAATILPGVFAFYVENRQPKHLVVIDNKGERSVFYADDGFTRDAVKALISEALSS